MINNSCGIIRDLLPLYTDKVCSEESKKAIEEHIEACPLCEAELLKLQSSPEIEAPLDADIENAVKNAGKRIKKGKKKAVIKTLSITMVVLLVVGILAYLVVPIKIAYHNYCNNGFLYSQCNLLEIEISNKKQPNTHGKCADIYIDESLGKYTVSKTENGDKITFEDGKELNIINIPTSKDSVKSFYEANGIFGIGGGSNFPYFNPIIKKGLEYMEIDPDTLYIDYTLYTKLLMSANENWTQRKTPLSPKKFAMWYTYYALYVNIMPNPVNSTGYYIHADNINLQGWGWSGFNEETGNRYVLSLQPKDNIYNNYTLIFTGFQREDMINTVESIVLK